MSGRFLGSIVFPGDVAEVPDARHHVRRLLARNGNPDSADDAELLTCECVSNAIRFTRSGANGGRIAVKLMGLDDALRVEVLDQGGSASVPVPRAAADSADAENGRGLYLINALAREWGTLPYGLGTLTWFTVPRGR
ncbi:ATP-binding protein [Actinomadura physcomitrii]|uniref:ATP-binding protein n=1 Tax=Actinomadura physcomitrii TaxID=2650748 RepID=UPI00136C5FF9|nr:ATP-binding protein [Actinomadura physcomitrii]